MTAAINAPTPSMISRLAPLILMRFWAAHQVAIPAIKAITHPAWTYFTASRRSVFTSTVTSASTTSIASKPSRSKMTKLAVKRVESDRVSADSISCAWPNWLLVFSSNAVSSSCLSDWLVNCLNAIMDFSISFLNFGSYASSAFSASSNPSR